MENSCLKNGLNGRHIPYLKRFPITKEALVEDSVIKPFRHDRVLNWLEECQRIKEDTKRSLNPSGSRWSGVESGKPKKPEPCFELRARSALKCLHQPRNKIGQEETEKTQKNIMFRRDIYKQNNPKVSHPKSITFSKDSLHHHMYNLRRMITMEDTYEEIVGHEDVKNSIELAFVQSNCVRDEINPKLTLKTILLVGVPGIGKTDLMINMGARIAKIIKKPVSVFVVSAADILSKYVGESEQSVNALWTVVDECAPSLVLFDEVDALMKARSGEESEHTRRLKNQLLSQMEGVRVQKNVITVASTNRGQELDIAFMRLFKLKFLLRPPNANERIEILTKFINLLPESKRVTLSPQDAKAFINMTACFTGDEIRSVVSHAVAASTMLYYKGKSYDAEGLKCIKKEIEASMDSPDGHLSRLTAQSILESISLVKPSCSSADVKALNKWAKKYCTQPKETKTFSRNTKRSGGSTILNTISQFRLP